METKNENLKDSILKKITEEKIEPKSRLYFTLKNISLWVLACLSVILGGIAISSVILRIASRARVLPPIQKESIHIIKQIFTLIPMFWVILFAVFAYLAYREIRNTKKGYKYTYPLIIVSTLFASTVLGIVFFAIGTASFVDKKIPEKIPFVEKIENLERKAWLDPENGLLAGEIVEVDESSITLRDGEGKEWLVETSLVPEFVKSKLVAGSNAGIIGYIKEDTFVACRIRIHESGKFSRSTERQGGDFVLDDSKKAEIEKGFTELRDNVCNIKE